MKWLRTAVTIVSLLLMVASLNGQIMSSEHTDVIVLMDTSGTVLPYHEVINERVLQSIISKFIRIGDSFHLLSFNAEARYEMSQKINDEADLSRVVSRFMLLYQLGQSADFLSGIHFAEQYMKALPSQQQKILIVISDGIFNPPKLSPYRQYTEEQIKTALAKSAASIRAEGWKVYYVKLPFPTNAVIKDLDGTFYAGKLDSSGNIDHSGVTEGSDTESASSMKQATSTAAAINHSAPARSMNTAADKPIGNNTVISHSDRIAGVVSTENIHKDPPAESTSASTPITISSSPTYADSGYKASPEVENRGSRIERSIESKAFAENRGIATDTGTIYTDTVPTEGIQIGTTDIAHANGTIDSTDEEIDQPVQQEIKEYTDVSKVFTENLGIETADLPEKGPIVFNDTVLPIPDIIFPEHIAISSEQFEFPVTIVNTAAESLDITLDNLVAEIDGKTYRQDMNKLAAHALPNTKTAMTVHINLPKSMYRQGQHQSTIRLDLVHNNKHFSRAATVLITMKPSVFESFMTGNIHWLLLASIGIIFLLLLILFIRNLRQEPVSSTTRKHGKLARGHQSGILKGSTVQQRDFQKTVQQRDFQKEERTGTDKRYYPEQQTNKTDPRESLNSFSSQTAAAAIVTQKETASQMNYLAQEHSRNMEGRFALLNSTENRLNHRPNFSQNYYGHINTKPSPSGMTELFVYNQTTSIGKRNIHMMKSGSRMSIGGSKNDNFLIFLVPFPANLAQIQYKGGEYQLFILKPEYFPYETENIIYNCIGRDITVVSKKGYHVTFSFRGYEDPMIKLNTILTSISHIAEQAKNV